MAKDFFPMPYAVYVIISPTKRNMLAEKLISRVGATDTVGGARALIAKDLQAMTQTFGGLIEASETKCREYRVFKAAWEPVKI